MKWSDLKINDPLTWQIYALRAEDESALYIGKTQFPRKRLACHILGKDSSCGSSNIPEDIRKSMTMEILEKCSKENSAARESYWLQHLKPQYNKMILGGAPTTKTAKQRYLDKHYGGVEPPPKTPKERYVQTFCRGVEPPPKPAPKTICECGKTFTAELKEWNLKQHCETSPQHLAWAATPKPTPTTNS